MVFEGVFDFIAFLILSKKTSLASDAIILNSLVKLPRVSDYAKQKEYSKLYIMLDNDSAGEEATKKLLKQFSNIATDYSSRYAPSKDIADYLLANVNSK